MAASWTGWCPLCYAGPLVLTDGRLTPAHLHSNGDNEPCRGVGMRAVGWSTAQHGMRERLYGR